MEDGLTQNTITDIIQDDDGYLWIATENGLNLYDGYTFTQFRHDPQNKNSIPSNFLIKFFIDSKKNLWITPRDEVGICKYLYDDKFETITFYDSDSVKAGNNMTILAEDDDSNLWLKSQYQAIDYGLICLNTQTGLYNLYRNNKDSNIICSNNIKKIFFINKSLLVVCEAGISIFDYEKNKFNNIFFNEGYIKEAIQYNDSEILFISNKGLYKFSSISKSYQEIKNKDIVIGSRFICKDHINNIWMQKPNKGLVKLSPTFNAIVYNHKNSNINEHTQVETYFYEDKKNILFSTRGDGIKVYNYNTNSFSTISNDEDNPYSISDNNVRKIINTDNILWVATEQEGLNKLDLRKNVFKYISNKQCGKKILTSENVRSICKLDEYKLLIGTRGGGLNIVNETNLQGISISVSLNNVEIKNIEAICKNDKNNYWLGTKDNGLILFDLDSRRVIKHIQQILPGLSINYFRAVIKDTDGYIWAAGWGGVLKINPSSLEYKIIQHGEENKYLRSIDVNFCLMEDSKGYVWVGSEGGVAVYDKEGNVHERFTNNTSTKNTLSFNTVFSIFEDSNKNIWVGTFGGGLNLLNREKKTFINFQIKDGIPNDVIYGMIEDNNKNIWASTNNKLCKVNIIDTTFINYDVNDGLPSNAFSFGAYYKSDNKLYFGTQCGVVSFEPGKIKDLNSPPVYFTRFNVLNKKKYFDRDINEIAQVVLEHTDYTFSIQFTALELSNASKIKYAYKMSNIHNDWVECGYEKSATFSSLPYGDYEFKVKTIVPPSDNFASLQIKIHPAFWETDWFKLLIVSAILIVIYLLYRYRLLHIRKLEKTRLQIAQDLHDEIGSNLGSITILSRLAAETRIDESTKLEHLSNIKNTAIKVADSMRDIVWFIDPTNDSAEILLNKMIDFTSKILLETKYDFDIQENAFTDTLSLQKRRNIYLIYKEILTNISKHSKAKKVHVEMKRKKDLFILTISDDGVGFCIEEISYGSGLKNIDKRANEIDAVLELNSSYEKGTTTILQVNVK